MSNSISHSPMVRLVYLSTAASANDKTSKTTTNILETARINNMVTGITGALCSSKSHFLQVLEGPDLAVLSLYSDLAKDPRHHSLVLLSLDLASARLFGDWSMAQIEGQRPMADLYRTLLPKRHMGTGKKEAVAIMQSFMSELNAG